MKKHHMVLLILVLSICFANACEARNFVNLTFDGIGLMGNPLLFWPIIIAMFFVGMFFGSVYIRSYIILLSIELLMTHWLFYNQLPAWLANYTHWFVSTFRFIGIQKHTANVQAFFALTYISLPIGCYLFIKQVQTNVFFKREFFLSPLRNYKLNNPFTFLNYELDMSRNQSIQTHSYLKLFFFLIVLLITTMLFGTVVTFFVGDGVMHSFEFGGLSLWLEWNIKSLLFTIFFGVTYLALKDWILFAPILIANLRDNFINIYLNFKHRND